MVKDAVMGEEVELPPAMCDQYGNLIELGDWVETVQQPGGIFPPAPAKTGEVCVAWGAWHIVHYPDGPKYPHYILLENKINTVIIT